MSEEEILDSSLDLLRRLDPKHISKNLETICRIQPSIAEELLSSIDTPLKVSRCEKSGKSYLCCDYNRDGDSFRSPWSNSYYPSLGSEESEAPHPSEHLRELEKFANDSFDIYRDLYYEGGISSVYLWDTEDEDVGPDGQLGFAGVALLKKQVDSSSVNTQGSWDSIHVFEVEPSSNGKANYKVTSTVILDLENDEDNEMYLSGNLTRQTEKKVQFTDSASHVSNIGSIVEDTESKLRNLLQEVYFGKTKDILTDLRSIEPLDAKNQEKLRHQQLIENFQKV
ncbi:unnamed protein product [Ambrosiozyma monospora]|uniref:Unnamed protein product n=1 Tax=Ambrosiozyma monospora TaxID=43982 RepID=A0ACB5ST90_AMBMO|nr:unnamed protein product [Ambrosiozyma monospora]